MAGPEPRRSPCAHGLRTSPKLRTCVLPAERYAERWLRAEGLSPDRRWVGGLVLTMPIVGCTDSSFPEEADASTEESATAPATRPPTRGERSISIGRYRRRSGSSTSGARAPVRRRSSGGRRRRHLRLVRLRRDCRRRGHANMRVRQGQPGPERPGPETARAPELVGDLERASSRQRRSPGLMSLSARPAVAT